jgi:hypothetical protein
MPSCRALPGPGVVGRPKSPRRRGRRERPHPPQVPSCVKTMRHNPWPPRSGSWVWSVSSSLLLGADDVATLRPRCDAVDLLIRRLMKVFNPASPRARYSQSSHLFAYPDRQDRGARRGDGQHLRVAHIRRTTPAGVMTAAQEHQIRFPRRARPRCTGERLDASETHCPRVRCRRRGRHTARCACRSPVSSYRLRIRVADRASIRAMTSSRERGVDGSVTEVELGGQPRKPRRLSR